MVIPVLKIGKVQIRNIFETQLAEPYPDPDDLLSEKALFFLFFADLLLRVKYIPVPQQQMVLNALNRANIWPPEKKDRLQHCPFVVADGRYCTWGGHTGFLDLETGDSVKQLPDPPLETIGYNLIELYRRGVLQAEEWKNAKKHSTGSVDES